MHSDNEVYKTTELNQHSKLTFSQKESSNKLLAQPFDYALASSEEHLKYFLAIDKMDCSSATLLDFEHQALLRRLYAHGLLIFDDLKSYFLNPSVRERLRIEGIRIETSKLNALQQDDLQCKMISNLDSRDMRTFNNRFGFACFPVGREESFNGRKYEVLTSSLKQSIGAGIYFGFNLEEYPDRFFLQEASIRLLSDTLVLYGSYECAPDTRSDWRIISLSHEVAKFYSSPLDQKNDIFAATSDFLIHHEIGHEFGRDSKCPIRKLIKESIGSDWIPRGTAFPTPAQLGSWKRIREARHSIDDVCFVFGDMLANFVAFENGIPEHSEALLRAFHWWILPLVSDQQTPRGGSAFLRLSYEREVDKFRAQLEEIFHSCLYEPDTTCKLMLQFEQRSWDWLIQNFAK